MPGRCFGLPVGMLLIGAVCLLGLTACGKGPFSPEARQQEAEREQYLKTLQAALAVDDTFEWKRLGSALIVRALPYDADVKLAAEQRFAGSASFQKDVSQWMRPVKNSRGEPTVILMGLFAPDLKENDLTKLDRFRPRLRTADGRLLEPVELKRYGRDAVFMRDFFPVFNPWEHVYMVKFAPSSGLSAYYNGQLEFVLQWPGGQQSLVLK